MDLKSIWACATAILAIVPLAAVASDIDLNLSPAKEAFVLNEPITVRMVLKNTSSRAIGLPLDYPHSLGIRFTCEGDDAAQTRSVNAPKGRGPIRTVELMPSGTYSATIVLDRYLGLSEPKRYVIQYLASYQEPATQEDPKGYSAAGQFTIDIRPGQFRADAGAHVKDLASMTGQELREAVEYLLWVDDPSIIDSLVEAAKLVPDAGVDIVGALRKFVAEEKGRKALCAVAEAGENEVLMAALAVCAERGCDMPYDFYHRLSLSKDVAKRFALVEHINDRDDDRYRALAERLMVDDSDKIAKMAGRFLDRHAVTHWTWHLPRLVVPLCGLVLLALLAWRHMHPKES